VILAVDGKTMENVSHLRNTIANLGANKRITLRVFRDGREQNIAVTLGERPQNPEIARGGEERGGKAKSFGGLVVSPLNKATRATFQIPDEVTSGVVVTGIEAGSEAEQAGLQPGDVIRKINNRPAASVDAVIREYEKAKNKVLLYIWREGSNLFLILEKI